MTPPFDRDRQIELMKTSAARHERRFADWMTNRSVREVVSRPAPGQGDEVLYTVEHKRVACR